MNKLLGLICILLGISFFIASCDDFFSPVIEIFVQNENQDKLQNENDRKHKIKIKEEKQQNINVQDNGKK